MFLNIMPKHTPHSEHINAAASIMKSHPTLTAAMAMQLAGFSEEDYSKPSFHALVRRRLPGRGKRAYQKTLRTLSAPLPPAVRGPIADIVVVPGKEGDEETVGSPLTDPTFDHPVPAPPKKMRLTLTTKQKQDARTAILKEKEVYKAAHKAATILYALERSKEGIGDGSEEEQVMYRLIQEANDVATFTLTMCHLGEEGCCTRQRMDGDEFEDPIVIT